MTRWWIALRRIPLLGAFAVALAIGLAAKPAAAEPYSDTVAPSSRAAGWVIVIHGGGWKLVGRGMTGIEQPEVDRLHQWGFGTMNVDYRQGAAGLTDVLRFERRLRRRVGPHVPICVDGASAGGHLALMVALRRPDVACVIARAAPTRLARLHGKLLRYAHHYFDGHGGLARWSPALRRLDTPLLLAHGADDPYVPFGQSQAMHRDAPNSRLFRLRPGKEPWVHTSVRAADLTRLYRVERRFLDRAGR